MLPTYGHKHGICHGMQLLECKLLSKAKLEYMLRDHKPLTPHTIIRRCKVTHDQA